MNILWNIKFHNDNVPREKKLKKRLTHLDDWSVYFFP